MRTGIVVRRATGEPAAERREAAMAKARRLAEERRAAEEAAAAAAAEAALAEAPRPAGRIRKPRRGVFYSAIYPSVELGPIHLASQ